jgi:hypothetical protein
MPTKLEEELLALAAAERGRREGSPNLPDPLGPQLLYTATLTAERVQGLDPTISVTVDPHLPEGVVFAVPSNSPLARDLQGGPQGSISMGCTVEAAQRDEISVEELSRLFMGSEARAQMSLRSFMGPILDWGQGEDTTAVETFDIEFDSNFEASVTPNEAVRFQVGRESPPSVRMDRNITPTDGRVVSRRGIDGRFRPEVGQVASMGVRPTEVVAGSSSGSDMVSLDPRPDPAPGRVTRPFTRPSASQERAARPTALERLVGRGPFDDD